MAIKNFFTGKPMTLQAKFTIYNTVSKALIILVFVAILPIIVEKIAYDHIDRRLTARSEKVLRIIQRGGIDDIVLEQDCSFESYSILKEEFVAIYPILKPSIKKPKIEIKNESWSIEGERLEHRIFRRQFTYDNQLYELNIGEGISNIEELKSTIQRFSLWIMLGIISISIFLDLGFVRLLLKPLNKIIINKLKPVPSPASFDFTSIPSSTFEFHKLDQRINEMMHKLKDAFQIEKEFITNVSHELQTPISIVQNRIENIIVEGNAPDDVVIRLTDSQRTLNRMSRIIKALLLMSKIENDQYIKTDVVKINELLEEVLEEVDDRLNQKNIRLYKNFYDDIELKPCNKALLFTLFSNLLNNAIKYNKQNGSITITTHQVNNKFTIEIRDTGIGIDESEQQAIFDRFKRLNKNEAEGYGLGLPIVKTIAAFHNIDIDVTSEPEVGSVFTLSIN